MNDKPDWMPKHTVTVEGRWLIVEGTHNCDWFSIDNIVRLESPMPTGKPSGWLEFYSGAVYLKGQSQFERLYLCRDAWEKLCALLGTKARGELKQ